MLDNQTILITGAAGMLGSAFGDVLEREYDCRVLAYDHGGLDVTDTKKVLALESEKPDIIIHCAAYVNADGCEDDPRLCHEVQVIGTRNMVDLAKSCGAKVLYPQSFLIF
ncbi:MAG: sugar nucleotide-binding protein, partial [Rhodospirillales bacterium]|nr:sugar nucleotide-binding protein [Rhodospirillales bacterium]